MNQPRTDLSPRGMLPYDAQRHCAEAAQMLPYEPLDWLRFVACSVVAFMVLALAFVLTGVSGQSVRRGVAFLLLALGIGCQSPEVIELDARFMPLQRLRQAQVPGLGEGMVATIYTEVLTRDLGALLDAYPQGSVELEALLLHEREHSFREFANPLFLGEYAASSAIRWREEKIGWGKEIEVLRAHGKAIDAEWVAQTLAGPAYRGMTDIETARAWVQEQLR